MAREIPEGIAIETVWVLEATYGPDWQERRPAVRPEHLSRLASLRDRGVVIEAGGYLDGAGSLLILRVPDEQAALELGRTDVYARSGVWPDMRARPLGRVVRQDETAT